MQELSRLAKGLYDLYMQLMNLDFTGDIAIDNDEDVIRVWEAKIFNQHIPDIPFADFTAEKIEEICIAYQKVRAHLPIVSRPAWVIHPDNVHKIIRQRFNGKAILYWNRSSVDLSTQIAYFTDNDPDDYESAAWKVWYVEYHKDKHREPMEYISSDNFYLALPKRKVHIIR
jgi:hypothetical protein